VIHKCSTEQAQGLRKKPRRAMSFRDKVRSMAACPPGMLDAAEEAEMRSNRVAEVSWYRLTLRLVFWLYTEEMSRAVELKKTAMGQLCSPEPQASASSSDKRPSDPFAVFQLTQQILEKPVLQPSRVPTMSTPRSCQHEWICRSNQYLNWYTCKQCAIRRRRAANELWSGE
jgi:hypothetical protein